MNVRLFCVCAVWLFSSAVVAQDAERFRDLVIAPEQESDSYDRDDWPHWEDLDDDDEDTRVEVLIEESIVPAVVEERTRGRRVTSGLWVGKYTGTVTTSPSGFQIDHLVPLKEAHESGGHAWTEEQRLRFANDLDDAVALIAVRGGANGSKGARDPAEWMPPNRAYWCEYLESWVAVKQKYELSIDPEEASALREGFRVCGRYKSGDKLEGRH